MVGNVEQWEERYREQGYAAGTEPTAFLREALPFLPACGSSGRVPRPSSPRAAGRHRGLALDIAAGAGRNAVFLAEHGWRAVALDRSRAALERAEALARARNVPVSWASAEAVANLSATPRQIPEVLLLQADLEEELPPVAASQFALVTCFYYLQRSLFSPIECWLRPAGWLVYETYTVEQLRFAHGPRNPEHLLRPGELREAFPGLETIFYREVTAGKGIASLLARKR